MKSAMNCSGLPAEQRQVDNLPSGLALFSCVQRGLLNSEVALFLEKENHDFPSGIVRERS